MAVTHIPGKLEKITTITPDTVRKFKPEDLDKWTSKIASAKMGDIIRDWEMFDASNEGGAKIHLAIIVERPDEIELQ